MMPVQEICDPFLRNRSSLGNEASTRGGRLVGICEKVNTNRQLEIAKQQEIRVRLESDDTPISDILTT